MRVSKITLRAELQSVENAAQSTDAHIELVQSFKISGATRALTESHTIDLKDDSIIELVYDDNTTWFCSPDTIGEIYPDAETKSRGPEDAFEIPTALQSVDSERGVVTSILLKLVNVFTKKKINLEVEKIAQDLEKKQLENQSGLYTVDGNFSLQRFSPSRSTNPYLLFLHGTGSSSKGSFGELMGSDLWNYIQKTYSTNVLAFQHETLTKSPLQNALELIKQLPTNTKLHVISHSRGGLVGDVLSKFCETDNTGFTEEEIIYLRKEGRKSDVSNIHAIAELLSNKRIHIEKFVRVACPAQGTTLASKRLDTYLNVIFNLLGYGTGAAANPIFIAFKNLIVSVIDSKNDVNVLPGLEAMNPSSAFIKILNNAKDPVAVNDSLMIIAGNCKMRLDLKALLVIVSKIFYQHKNDLVVDTESMYQGAKRSGIVQYFFDEGVEVDHFHYFKNKRTTDAIKLALSTSVPGLVPSFKVWPDELEAAERNALFKLDGGEVFRDTVTGAKPIVVLLPGIMGSNLAQKKKKLWINYLQFIIGGLSKLNIASNDIEATSLISTSYSRLVKYLDATYDVVTFPFDWRLPLTDSANVFNTKIKDLLKYNQPIKIIGHSMGGVLVRDFINSHNDTWQQLNKTDGFRLIFLGAPLGGSYRIPAVLFGQDDIINKLARVDITQNKKDLLKTFSKLPGLLNLLPLDKSIDFSDANTWGAMKNALGDANWPVPEKDELKQFKLYRDKVKPFVEDEDCKNVVYVAGQDKSTPCGFRIDNLSGGKKELVFLSTAEGDQSVTWESGIPRKLIDLNSVYYANVTHGSLANEPSIFGAIAEILANGSTNLLSKTRPNVRGGEKLFRTPISSDFDFSERGIEKTLLGLASEDLSRNDTPIQLSVVNGDLKFASYPILAGHFWNDGILYAEKAIDKNLGGELQKRYRLGIYPGEIGSSEVLISNKENFNGAIIVGLGKPGELTAYQLGLTVEQGVSKYLVSKNDSSIKQNGQPLSNGISALLIACGYGGLSIDAATRAIMQGISSANQKIADLYGENVKLIEFVEFIEQYKDRSLSCLHTIHMLQKDPSFNVVVSKKKIQLRLGTRDRLPIDSSNEWWTRINVALKESGKDDKIVRSLRFNISTGGAREEQSDVYTAKEVIEQLIDEISTQNQWTPALAKTIFELLIPTDFKEQIKKQGNINWIVDIDTAAYPWELLQDTIGKADPLSINAGMVRQLATQNYRRKINSVTNSNALVVGDPNLKGFVNQLPGARKEGKQVTNQLSSGGYQVNTLLFSSASDIIKALFSTDYKIIHLAGHGIFNKDYTKGSGMVIGDNVFLSSREINQMSTVPELVFVNCCFLGKTEGVAEQYYRDRYKLAANLGTQLINNGVKAVVVAGWAVDDAAALEFAEEFYAQMLDGEQFGKAVQRARIKIYNKYRHTNTWGAYQCYGDAFYRLATQSKESQEYEYSFLIPQEAEIALFNLHGEIEMSSVETESFRKRLEAISKAVDEADIRNANITEKEAIIYFDLFDYPSAISKYEELLNLENASFSASAMEKYCNIRAKQYVEDFIKNPGKQKFYLTKIEHVIADIKSLLRLGETAERYCLIGSAYKRKAVLASGSTKTSAYIQAALYYYQANAVSHNSNPAYSLTNFLLLSHLLVLQGKWFRGKSHVVNKITIDVPNRQEITTKLNNLKFALPPSEKMDYWDLISSANIDFTRFVLDGAKSDEINKVILPYKKAWEKYGSRGKKIAEVEHIEFLLDAFAQIPKAKKIKSSIEKVKQILEKMI